MSNKNGKLEKHKTIIPAYTVIRVAGGWAFVVLDLDEEWNTIGVHQSLPDMKAITTEAFRIAVGKYWGKLDEQGIHGSSDL